jgi:hypothetical protein
MDKSGLRRLRDDVDHASDDDAPRGKSASSATDGSAAASGDAAKFAASTIERH